MTDFQARKEGLLDMFRVWTAELERQCPTECSKNLESALTTVVEGFVKGRTDARIIIIPDGHSSERALVCLLDAIMTRPDADEIYKRQMSRVEKMVGDPVLKHRIRTMISNQRNMLEILSPEERDISKLIRQPKGAGLEHNARA